MIGSKAYMPTSKGSNTFTQLEAMGQLPTVPLSDLARVQHSSVYKTHTGLSKTSTAQRLGLHKHTRISENVHALTQESAEPNPRGCPPAFVSDP